MLLQSSALFALFISHHSFPFFLMIISRDSYCVFISGPAVDSFFRHKSWTSVILENSVCDSNFFVTFLFPGCDELVPE